jgi:hypothetical protein
MLAILTERVPSVYAQMHITRRYTEDEPGIQGYGREYRQCAGERSRGCRGQREQGEKEALGFDEGWG